MFVYKTPVSFECANNASIYPRWVLYVGRAGNHERAGSLRQRYRDEYQRYLGGHPEVLWNVDKPTSRPDRLKKYLTIYPLEYWFCSIDDHKVIGNLEDRLIKLFSPPLNDKSRLRLKPLISQQKPAFRKY
jgi:hypothetical protein